MSTQPIHQYLCHRCQQEDDHLEKMVHHQINVVMSRLNEQQKRWYTVVEANRHSHKGVVLVSKISRRPGWPTGGSGAFIKI